MMGLGCRFNLMMCVVVSSTLLVANSRSIDNAVAPKNKVNKVPSFSSVLWDDQYTYYSKKNLFALSAGLLVSGVMAQTSFDQKISNYVQDDLRTRSTDTWSSVAKVFGDRYVTMGVLGTAIGFHLISQKKHSYRFINRSMDHYLRAMLVGGPPFLFVQWALGASRPSAKTPHSFYRPFQNSNSVSASGHSFAGALPFLVMASEVENIWLKSFFYGTSTLTALSRLHDHQHYLSQVLLGWWMAFLSVKVTTWTEARSKWSFSVIPTSSGGVFTAALVL